MDHIDLKLISLLEENARYSIKELANHVFLSAPSVSSRIEKLEAAGIIAGYHVEIDELKLGFPITAFINLAMEPNQKPVFYPFIEACPNVIECSCVTGNYSMLIKVAFPSTQELDVFIGRLQEFGTTQTQIVFSTPVKHRTLKLEELKQDTKTK